MSFADVQRGVFIPDTCCCELLATHAVIGYVENQHPINALNAMSLNFVQNQIRDK